VLSPNIFNLKLWKTSGHYKNYKDNMFLLHIENQGFGVKPMNCPGHCIMFDSTVRSYRELPLRFADFGVLHRNEISGALSGLTRVRRFQQDDAHIFCAPEHIMDEIVACLNFLDHTYSAFDFKFELELSTRPADKLGDDALWD
jgi:threonyl-tRNA synthetase